MIRILGIIFVGLYLLIAFLSWDIQWVFNKYNIFYRFCYLCLSIFFIYLNWPLLFPENHLNKTGTDTKKKLESDEQKKTDYWC